MRIKPGLGSLAANEQREWEEWKGGKTREEGGRRGPEEGEGEKAVGCRGEAGREGGRGQVAGGRGGEGRGREESHNDDARYSKKERRKYIAAEDCDERESRRPPDIVFSL